MILFVSLALAMSLLALAIVIVPLLRTGPRPAPGHQGLAVLADSVRELDAERAAGSIDQDEHQRTLRELQRQALQAQPDSDGPVGQADVRARWTAALLTAIGMPLTVIMVYTLVGQPMALLSAPTAQAASPHGSGMAAAGATSELTKTAIGSLKQRLEKNADDGEGWVLLARSYLQLEQLPESIGAYRKAVALLPANADLLVELANTVAISQQRRLAGEPEQLAERALALDPDNFNALAFAGLAALQSGDRALALRRWQRLEALLPADSEDRRRIGTLIAQADTRADGVSSRPQASAVDTRAVAPTASAAASIRGQVVLDGALAGKVAPTDTLFIFAKAIDGPPMPLAAIRARAGDLPLSFTLDDSSAMAQGMALSSFSRVKVVARISRLGSVQSQAGDIEGMVGDVVVGSDGVRVLIDHVVGR